MKILRNGPSALRYDLVSTLTTVLNKESLSDVLLQISNHSFMELYKIIKEIYQNITKKHQPYSLEIVQAVLSVFSCRIIEPCDSLKVLGEGFSFVSRHSPFANDFLAEASRKRSFAYFFEQEFNLIIVKT